MRGFFSSSVIHKEKPIGLIPKCGSCGLFKLCESPKMKPHGKGKRGILIVGEAPGQMEDEEGRPFVGKAGRYLRQSLRELGYDLDRDATTTNALICRPPKNATPDRKQISWCRPNVLRTIQETEPRVIITLGRSALVSVLEPYWKSDMGEMGKWVGWRIPLEQFWVCPTYHPSFLMRMQNSLMDSLFSDHLQAAFEINTEPPKLEDRKIDLIYDDEEAFQAIREVDQVGGWAAVDYETNCIKPDWPKAKIISCSISNGERTFAYPWVGKAIPATGKFLKSGRTRKISSNLKMEERWTLKMFGHGVTNWGWDTMLASHCLDNRTGICSLKFQCFVKMGVPTSAYNKNIEPYLESHDGPYNRIQEVDLGQLLYYNGTDSLFERRLAMVQRKEMGYED